MVLVQIAVSPIGGYPCGYPHVGDKGDNRNAKIFAFWISLEWELL